MTWNVMLKKKKRKISLFLLVQKHLLLKSYILGDKFCKDTFTITSVQVSKPCGRALQHHMDYMLELQKVKSNIR